MDEYILTHLQALHIYVTLEHAQYMDAEITITVPSKLDETPVKVHFSKGMGIHITYEHKHSLIGGELYDTLRQFAIAYRII